MNVITGGANLDATLQRLIKEYENVEFAVAWATTHSKAYRTFLRHKKKIRHAAIGIHFYQTDADVLRDFVGHNSVRFVLQSSGVFHPKVYFFWNPEKWELLLGSANLTKGALSENSELMLHLSSQNTPATVKKQIQARIREYWQTGEVVTRDQAKAYRALWESHRPSLRKLSGPKGGTSPLKTKIMALSWASFLKSVKADKHHGFKERCSLLRLVNRAFRENASYARMELGLRQTIAGLKTEYHEHWAWFGNMSGAGYFHREVNQNNRYLSAALDAIPLDGAVVRHHYDAYVRQFVKAFPKGGDGVAVASRLLAMKRPDCFVCLDAKNKSQLCKDFGIKQSNMTYERYWDDVITRVHQAVWWGEPQPTSKTAFNVWSGRAAMLDAIFYDPGDR